MRICPRCKDAYEDYVETCPDCGVPLVGEDAEPPEWLSPEVWPELRYAPHTFDIFPFRSDEDAKRALEALEAYQIPAQAGLLNMQRAGASLFPREVLAVRVAQSDAQSAMEVLVAEVPTALPRAVVEEVWRGLASETPQIPPDLPERLADPLETLLAGGDELVPDLLSGFLAGGSLATRCHYVLVHMDADPELQLLQRALDACTNGDAETVGRLRYLLSDFADVRSISALGSFLRRSPPQARQLVAWLLGYIPLLDAVGLLVGMLEDADLDVRTQAIETLTRVCGRDLGYEPEAPEDERREMTEAWRGFLQWLERQEHGEDAGAPGEA